MADNIEGVELLSIVDVKGRKDDGSGKKLRVVQWIKEKQAGQWETINVQLEKRSYYLDPYGKPMTGKASGLTLDDLMACKPVWPKIIDLMKNPPAPKPAVQQPAAAAASDETPF